MKTNKLFSILAILALLMAAVPIMNVGAAGPVTVNKGNVALSGGFQTGNFPETWDLTAGDLTVSFTYDGNGLVDDAGAHAWAELGIRDKTTSSNFNPNNKGVWLATDYDWTANTFDPDITPNLDLDDKLLLQKVSGNGEGAYDLPSAPPAPGNNHRFWWDRDGVDPWQNDETANTAGVYNIVMTFHAASATTGTAFMTINGLNQGFETDGNWNTIELTPAGMTFTGDMTRMQVFYGIYGYGATHNISFQNIAIEGFPADLAGPVASNVVASPNPAAVGSTVTATANVDDSTTGGSNIASASYEIFDSNTVSVNSGSMSAVDVFDNPTEDVTANITAPSTPGIYDLCVRGTDVPGNVGAPECIMFVVYDPSGGFVTGGGWIDSPAGAVAPIETIAYFNGFETDIEGWLTPNRVMSGNNGIPSASGNYHAEATYDFTRWGGYNSVFPTNGFITSIDIYLNMNAGYANDTRFDWTSAISTPASAHRRDFVFTGGFYNDATGPGAGQNRFVFSASNNTPGWPKNPDRDPIAVTTTGWYTLQHRFFDSGAGILAVEMSVLDASDNVIHTWTLSDPTDVIGTTVGGNRYGWFATNGFPFLAIDNSVRKEFSNITGKATFGFVSKYKKGASVPDGNTEFQFKAGDLNFHSTSYDWLVVNQGGTNAQFKGFGTINGAGNYGFMIWAGDGSPDTFRIKIWDAVTEVVVYDNGMDQPIGGGSIVVHKK